MVTARRFLVEFSGSGTPAWVLRSATGALPKLQRDPANRLYWFNGKKYASEAAFLTAAGGVVSSNARVFGPYLDPTATNLIPQNATFDTDTTGWSTTGTGASLAVASGELVLTAAGNLSGFQQGIPSFVGRAGKFTGTGRRGTSANNFVLFTGNLNFGNGIGSAAINTTNPTTLSIYCTGVATGATNLYVGARDTSAAGTGTGIFDNFSLVEAWPFQGFPNPAAAGSLTVLVEGTTPSSASGNKVVWQSDCATERERVRLVWGADTHFHLIITCFNTGQADLDLGAVATSTAFSIAFQVGQNSFATSLNGGVPVTDASGICPGASIMQIGKSFTGEAWDGSDPLVVVW